MVERNSYSFDSFNDKTNEAKRLDLRASVGLEELLPTLIESGLKRGMRVLDVGSGTGRRALEIARFVKRGEVVGIDTSRDLLLHAQTLQTQIAQSNISFEVADVFSRRALAKLGRFDFIHARLVVQHLPNPIRALNNLKALLSNNGKIFIEDTDRDWMTVFPSPPEWDYIYLKMKQGQSKKGGDPNSGKKLGYYLSKTGFQSVRVRMVPVAGANERVLDWVRNYAPSYVTFLSSKDVGPAKRALLKIERMAQKQPTFFYQTWFQATGQKGS